MTMNISRVLALLSAAFLLAASSSSGAVGRQNQDEAQATLSTELVDVLVTVVDSGGRPVRGLTRSNFAVFDDGVLQDVAHFSDESAPIRLGVVLDATGMSANNIDEWLDALRGSQLVTERAAEVSFVALNEKASVAMEFVGTSGRVLQQLQSFDPRGPRTLREAVADVERGFRRPDSATSAVVLITTGYTRLGSHRVSNVVDSGQARLFVVFPVERNDDVELTSTDGTYGLPSPLGRANAFDTDGNQLNRAALASVARRSGGRSSYALAECGESPVEIIARIGDQVSSPYALGFYPSLAHPGSHRIVVRLTSAASVRGVSLSYRTGYRSAP